MEPFSVHEVMCFVSTQFDKLNRENLYSTLIEFYSCDELIAAKQVLISICQKNVSNAINSSKKKFSTIFLTYGKLLTQNMAASFRLSLWQQILLVCHWLTQTNTTWNFLSHLFWKFKNKTNISGGNAVNGYSSKTAWREWGDIFITIRKNTNLWQA